MRAARGSLAVDLLLYDQVLLYLDDFRVLADLAEWLGPANFDALLGQDVIRIVWCSAHTGLMSRHAEYREDGGKPGLNAYEIYADPEGNLYDLEDHVRRALKLGAPGHRWGRARRDDFTRRVISLVAREFSQNTVRAAIEETRQDLLDPQLRATFGIRTEDDRILETDDRDVQRLLRLNYLNVGLQVAADVESAALHAEEAFGRLVPHKLDAIDTPDLLTENLVEYSDIDDLPDPSVFGRDRIAFARLVTLRGSRAGEQFRLWLDDNLRDTEDRKDLLRAARRELRVGTSRRPLRAFAVNGASMVASAATSNPVTGAVAGFAAGKLVDRAASRLQQMLGQGWSLNGFLDEDLAEIRAMADPESADPLRLGSVEP